MLTAERDPDFAKTAQERLPKNKKLIVYCGLGGTITVGAQPYKPGGKSFKDDPERMFGRESRSLKACYELLQVSLSFLIYCKPPRPAAVNCPCELEGEDTRLNPFMRYCKQTMEQCLLELESWWRLSVAWADLQQAGYKDVVHLKGGLSQWRHDGYPVE